jgi:hypothetical protein
MVAGTWLGNGLEASELEEAISAIAGEVAQAWDSQSIVIGDEPR